MPFQVFDVWDQAALTNEITRPPAGRDPGAAEDGAVLLGETIAPVKNIQTRTAKQRVRELKPFGKGQFVAPGATPGMYNPGLSWQEKIIGLVLLEELHPIEVEEWIKLNSADENVVRSAGVELIERGRIMARRNERLTEWMRWEMLLTGSLLVTYPQGGSLEVGYDFSAGHLPTAGTLWSTVSTADPVADVQAWSEKLADDCGFFARYVHMNSKTFDLLVRNQAIISTINFFANNAAAIQRPRRQDLLELFSSFFVNQEIVLYDNGFRDEGATGIGRPSLTQYLPYGKVLVTGPYVIDGVNIAETLNGQVVISTGYNQTDIRQGFQAEVLLDHLSKTHYFRAASAKIPRLNYPEAVLTATVA